MGLNGDNHAESMGEAASDEPGDHVHGSPRASPSTTPLRALGQGTLFTIPPLVDEPEIQTKVPAFPVWSESKATLVAQYLRRFVLVTKHGIYIDGFAGPQHPDRPEMWTAKLVLENEPAWLRHFHLFEQDAQKQRHLEALRRVHGERVTLHRGDFNSIVQEILVPEIVPPNQATFCLIDQWTFECDWATVERLARYRSGASSYKMEIFYFLAHKWFDRAFAGPHRTGAKRVEPWWGRDDWPALGGMNGLERAALVGERFRQELGYRSAKAWPIYGRKQGGPVMYFMIHATDHARAPSLMADAYSSIVPPGPRPEQLDFDTLL